MITSKHRKELEEEAEEEAQNGGEYTAIMRRSFLRGAEALARIQSEGHMKNSADLTKGLARTDEMIATDGNNITIVSAGAFARLQSETSGSDEESAYTYGEEASYCYPSANDVAKRAFLAGCARYRPLVEEMLIALNLDQDNEDCESRIKNAAARAEKLLGKKD